MGCPLRQPRARSRPILHSYTRSRDGHRYGCQSTRAWLDNRRMFQNALGLHSSSLPLPQHNK